MTRGVNLLLMLLLQRLGFAAMLTLVCVVVAAMVVTVAAAHVMTVLEGLAVVMGCVATPVTPIVVPGQVRPRVSIRQLLVVILS